MSRTPLSVSHPFIFRIWESDNCSLHLNEYVISTIQMCTVDVAEHERCLSVLEDTSNERDELKIEVERLKKELEECKETAMSLAVLSGVEGERRAMERVERAMNELLVEDDLSGEYTAAMNDLRDELGLGEEYSDNDNYTNTGVE